MHLPPVRLTADGTVSGILLKSAGSPQLAPTLRCYESQERNADPTNILTGSAKLIVGEVMDELVQASGGGGQGSDEAA